MPCSRALQVPSCEARRVAPDRSTSTDMDACRLRNTIGRPFDWMRDHEETKGTTSAASRQALTRPHERSDGTKAVSQLEWTTPVRHQRDTGRRTHTWSTSRELRLDLREIEGAGRPGRPVRPAEDCEEPVNGLDAGRDGSEVPIDVRAKQPAEERVGSTLLQIVRPLATTMRRARASSV